MNKWFAAVLVVGVIAGVTTCVMAAETVSEIGWAAAGQGTPGFTVVAPSPEADFARARVTSPVAAPRTTTVLTLADPGISQPTYAITGKLRCEDVGGEGYLEMWSFFPNGGRYFTRTLAPQGPMATLKGSSGWRRFVLPFFVKNSRQRPNKLVVNVVLPQGGTVDLGPLKLMQYAAGEDPLALPGQWWSGRVGGLLGGLLGTLLGGLGAAIGILSSMGRQRGLVLGLMSAGIVVGWVLFAVGVAAFVMHQPYGVYYPLVLTGGLATGLCAGLRHHVRRRYDELELRRMSAQDTA